jgi:hypothetical protein
MGRKSSFSGSKAAKICQFLADGLSLRQACQSVKGAKPSTVIGWVLDPKRKKFAEQYARARLVGYHVQADTILDTAADESRDGPLPAGKDGERPSGTAVQRDRLKVDSLKWVLSKMLPKEFGDNIEPKDETIKDRPTAIVFMREPDPPSRDE